MYTTTKRKEPKKMAKDVVAQTQEKMRDLKEKRQAEIDYICAQLDQAEAEYTAASNEIKDAMEQTDLTRYTEAKRAQLEAKNKREMFSGRLKQLRAHEYVSETESDAVIDALLRFEDELAEKYGNRTAEIIATLKNVHTEYRDAVNAAERTIRQWENEIHANYNSRGRSTYTDSFTGVKTQRSNTPIPVRTAPYAGSAKSEIVNTFLNKIENE